MKKINKRYLLCGIRRITQMVKKKIEASDLYALCNIEQFFTCGTVEQYMKMYELTKSGVTQLELAYILYVCSKQTLIFIYNAIEQLFSNGEDEKDGND